MTSPTTLYKFDLGTYEVVENKLGVVTIHLGNNVHIHVHLIHGFHCTLVPGAKIALFTELPCQVSTS